MIKNIAAVVSGMDEEYPYHIIRGINDFARKNNLNISYFASFGGIVDSNYFDIGEFSIYSLPDFSTFDGALLLTNTFANLDVRNKLIDKIKAAKIPTVIFECSDYDEFHDISIDNYSVMKQMMKHLIEVHHARTFNFISGPNTNPEAQARYQAFKDALKEYGLDFDEDRFYQGRFRSYDGIMAIEEYLCSGQKLPNAFVCANDSMALTAMSLLQRMGYKIPEDVIITGFDNTFNAQNSYPILTTVKRPLYDSGYKACSILYELMNGHDQPKSTLLEATPVYAQSCGCNLHDTEDINEFKRSTYQRIERTYTSVHMLNRLIAALAGAQNMTEFVDALEQMTSTLSLNDFSLCLIADWEDTFHTLPIENGFGNYPPNMTAPLVWKNGEKHSLDYFPSRQLFPVPQTTGGNISYFMPLHFDDRCLGYYIITNNDFPIYSLLCHTMSMCIGNAIESVSKLNVIDPMCKVYNRNGFTRNAEQIFKSCVNDNLSLMVSFIDMDGLKYINDNFGHNEGDIAIQLTAQAINSCCRGGSDICARFGGDEFIVLCSNVPDNFDKLFIERFQQKLDKINTTQDRPYIVSASTGCVIAHPSKQDKLADMIKLADTKMYALKREKKKTLKIARDNQ